MSIFDIPDFEKHGNNDEDTHLTDLEGIQKSVLEICSHATRKILILSPDLESSIYNNETFTKTLLDFIRGNRHASVKILIADSSKAVKNGHAVLRLSQQLTTAIEIKKLAEEFHDTTTGFIVVDNSSFLYKPDIRIHEGIYNPNCKFRTEKLSEIFTSIWEQSEQDLQTKRMYL